MLGSQNVLVVFGLHFGLIDLLVNIWYEEKDQTKPVRMQFFFFNFIFNCIKKIKLKSKRPPNR